MLPSYSTTEMNSSIIGIHNGGERVFSDKRTIRNGNRILVLTKVSERLKLV